jgi:hypothetical protein
MNSETRNKLEQAWHDLYAAAGSSHADHEALRVALLNTMHLAGLINSMDNCGDRRGLALLGRELTALLRRFIDRGLEGEIWTTDQPPLGLTKEPDTITVDISHPETQAFLAPLLAEVEEKRKRQDFLTAISDALTALAAIDGTTFDLWSDESPWAPQSWRVVAVWYPPAARDWPHIRFTANRCDDEHGTVADIRACALVQDTALVGVTVMAKSLSGTQLQGLATDAMAALRKLQNKEQT